MRLPCNFNGSVSFGWNGSDGIAYAAAEGTVSINVNPINDAPTVSNFSLSGNEDANIALSSQDFSDNFSDAEGDSLAKIKITSLPGNGLLTLDGAAVKANQEIDATGDLLDKLVFAPGANWNGSTIFGWNGFDGSSYAETEATGELTVNAVNDAPIARAIASQTTVENLSFEFQLAQNFFSDIDGDSLSYSAATPTWLSFDPSSSTFSGIPSSGDVGTYVIEVTASDGQDTVSTTFELTVNANNPPFVANSVLSQVRGDHNGSQFSFAADSYIDPDPGDSITYSISIAGGDTLPSWLSFDPATRTINIDKANRPNSFDYDLKVTGTDPYGASVSEFIHFYSYQLRGFIIDNYIAGAFVFWDANKNGIQDAGEPSTTSDQAGEFNLDVAIEDYDANNNGILDPAEGQIVAFGGIDTATGLPLETPVTATPEATVVTLLTTLVADLVDKGLTVNEANERVVASLSLPSGVDLNSLDPIAATENNEFGGVETLTAMVKVQNAITQIASLVDGASNADFNLIVRNVVEAITSQIQTGVTLDVSNPETLEAIIKDAAGATQQDDPNIDLTRVEAIASGAAQVMAESNQQIDALVASGASGANLTASIANVQKVTLGDITEELEAAAQGTKEIAQVVAENTGFALEAKINPPEPTAPAPQEAIANAPVGNPNTSLVPSLPTLVANIELVRNDATEGSDRDDTYIGDDRDNSYLAYSGNDTLFGNSGDDWMNGNRGDDSLDGGEGDDTLYGGKNNDTISGNNGADVIFGNRGKDSLFGNDGDDFLNGNQAEDELFGGDGNDMLHGGKQNDTLTGGDGSDTLSGDLGNDLLTGGDGSDRFVLKLGYDSDVLTDFEDGQDFLALANGLSFEQLAISQESGATLIRVGDELLATLENVDASLISSEDFLALS